MGRPISNIDPSIEILWLKFKESDLCPGCSKWDVTIRRQHTRDRPPRFFYRYDCQLCKTSWAHLGVKLTYLPIQECVLNNCVVRAKDYRGEKVYKTL